jgi:hypothetical protein
MIASYRSMVSCTLLVGFLAGTLACANTTNAQRQIPKRNLDTMIVLTIGSHATGPSYLGKRLHGLKDFVTDHPGENGLFDIFCSATDTEALRPGQSISATATLEPHSNPKRVARHRYQLRPC